jgi:hypothetical protein
MKWQVEGIASCAFFAPNNPIKAVRSQKNQVQADFWNSQSMLKIRFPLMDYMDAINKKQPIIYLNHTLPLPFL